MKIRIIASEAEPVDLDKQTYAGRGGVTPDDPGDPPMSMREEIGERLRQCINSDPWFQRHGIYLGGPGAVDVRPDMHLHDELERDIDHYLRFLDLGQVMEGVTRRVTAHHQKMMRQQREAGRAEYAPF